MTPRVGEIWYHRHAQLHALILEDKGEPDNWHYFDLLWLEDGTIHENYPFQWGLRMLERVL